MLNEAMKSIILFVVEGYSDYVALKAPLRNWLIKRGFHNEFDVDIYGTDPLIHDPEDKGNPILRDPSEVQDRIKKSVKDYLNKAQNKRTIKASDISCVILISDLDGCYCSPDSIAQNDYGTGVILYDTSCRMIRCNNVDYVQRRNEAKRDAIDLITHEKNILLSGCKKAIPLAIFYFNLNMEHALHGVNEPGLSEQEKISYAMWFRNTYAFNENSLASYLKTLLPKEGVDYRTSWDKRTLGERAFDRLCNLALVIEWLNMFLPR